MRRVRPHRRERGASIVELALIAPVMVLLVMGFLDLGRSYRMQIRLENAAREGAALAQLLPNRVSCPTGSDIEDRSRGEDVALTSTPGFAVNVTNIDSDGTEVLLTGCSGTAARPGERVRVEVSAEFGIMTPVVANIVGDSIGLSGVAEVRVQGKVGP